MLLNLYYIYHIILQNIRDDTILHVCKECCQEGNERSKKLDDEEVSRDELLDTPMSNSYDVTHNNIEYNDSECMRGLNMVEESLISIISAVVIVQKTDGKI
jgi:hypothetical protein